MKNFFVLLAKGIGIALTISLSVCFLAWKWGNWRAVIWYVFGLLVIWQVWRYLRSDIVLCQYERDEMVERSASLLEKTEELIIGLFFIMIGVGFFWGVGWITEQVFNYPSVIFEYTIAKGFITFLLLCIGWWMTGMMYCAIKELEWKSFIPLTPPAIKWLLIIAISSAIGITVLYYGYPH